MNVTPMAPSPPAACVGGETSLLGIRGGAGGAVLHRRRQGRAEKRQKVKRSKRGLRVGPPPARRLYAEPRASREGDRQSEGGQRRGKPRPPYAFSMIQRMLAI